MELNEGSVTHIACCPPVYPKFAFDCILFSQSWHRYGFYTCFKIFLGRYQELRGYCCWSLWPSLDEKTVAVMLACYSFLKSEPTAGLHRPEFRFSRTDTLLYCSSLPVMCTQEDWSVVEAVFCSVHFCMVDRKSICHLRNPIQLSPKLLFCGTWPYPE